MIQFNLLPDVKVAYIKAKKAKRIVVVVAGISVVVSLALLILMFSAVTLQKKHISDLNKDIKKLSSSQNNTKDLAKILTIQNQLNSLPELYEKRPVTSRIYGYINATTPADVSMTKIGLQFDTSALNITGSAKSLEAVNRYIDTLKFTTYTVDDSDEVVKAFSQVVLTSFNRDADAATYTVDFLFDPIIFDSSKTVTLNVPNTVTTRSQTELPGAATGVFDTKETN